MSAQIGVNGGIWEMVRISKQPEARRQEILDVATQLFLERGFENTTVSDIVRTVGVAQGLFYYYFKSKEELMVAVMLRYAEAFIETVKQTIEDNSVPPVERILRIAAQIPVILYSRDMFCAKIEREERKAAFDQFMWMTMDILLPYVTVLIEEGNARGDFDAPYAAHTAKFLLAGFVGLSVGEPHVAAEEMMDMICALCERVLMMQSGALSENTAGKEA